MPLVAHRYEILRPLGSGGMAEVMVAHDTRLGRDVAIKLIRSEQLAEPVSRERLLREARAAAALHHPNTVEVYDVGEDDDPYIVMELVEGETLEARLRRQAPLPVAESVRIGCALLDALEAAHDRGLVHRDIKPSNVLLSTAGGVKLADFGIAKAIDGADPGLTMTGQVLGTPRYLSPEQAAGEPATRVSDLYSLGAVLYECVAGKPPFDGPSAIAVALAHQRSPVPPLLEVAPQLPTSVASTIERALRKDPEQRFADAAEMRSSLQDAVAGPGASTRTATVPHLGAVPAATRQLPEQVDAAAMTRPLEVAPSQRGSGADVDNPPMGNGRGERARGWWWLAAVLAVVAVLAVAVLPRLGGTADGPREGADGAAEQPDEQAEEPEADGGDPDDQVAAEPDPESESAPAPDTGPGSLDQLIAELARDPDAAGRHGDRLLRELMELRDEGDPGDRAEDARDLIKEIAGWRTRDHLDAAAATAAVTVLESIGRPPDPDLADVSALFAEIALERDAWGRKAKDLLDDLDDLLGDDPEDRAEDAADIIAEIDGWIDKDELDRDRGGRAQQALAPLATPL
ncbi:MAG: serine/threonine protein kinase [Nitriliruptor sp.]|nr:MAG: serine/threonine protein kinase [Nitriliruptor sp.]